jgi:hypothetical protein
MCRSTQPVAVSSRLGVTRRRAVALRSRRLSLCAVVAGDGHAPIPELRYGWNDLEVVRGVGHQREAAVEVVGHVRALRGDAAAVGDASLQTSEDRIKRNRRADECAASWRTSAHISGSSAHSSGGSTGSGGKSFTFRPIHPTTSRRVGHAHHPAWQHQRADHRHRRARGGPDPRPIHEHGRECRCGNDRLTLECAA